LGEDFAVPGNHELSGMAGILTLLQPFFSSELNSDAGRGPRLRFRVKANSILDVFFLPGRNFSCFLNDEAEIEADWRV
jgi:hypothetical protein